MDIYLKVNNNFNELTVIKLTTVDKKKLFKFKLEFCRMNF